jgi:outer membrane protein TolC
VEDSVVGLDGLIVIAHQNNPKRRQANTRLSAALGEALEAGLYPNPTAGYNGDQIGAMDIGGEFQGGEFQGGAAARGRLELFEQSACALR